MPNLNSVMLMGNVTRDVELRYTPNNTAVCQIGLAINHKWKDSNGEPKEEVTFVDCEAWGRTAEVANQYLRKGSPIFFQGRLKLDQWVDKEGKNRSKLKVVVESMQFIDSRRDENAKHAQGGGEPRKAPARQAPNGPQSVGVNPDARGAGDDEHIPFNPNPWLPA